MSSNLNPSKLSQARAAGSIFLQDVGKGVLTLTHSGLAMVGLVVVLGMGVALFRPDILAQTESRFTNGFAHVNLACGGSLKTPPTGPLPPI